jgi:hypothetical protein
MTEVDLSTLSTARSDASATLSMARLLTNMARRGTYDSRPGSPNYDRNHYTQPLQPDEQITTAYPAVVGVGSTAVPAVVRETNRGNIYVDPYRFPPAPGLIASAAARRVRQLGLQQPMLFRSDQVQRLLQRPDRIEISAPGVAIRGFPDAPMGKVTDLSLKDQFFHAWRLARG